MSLMIMLVIILVMVMIMARGMAQMDAVLDSLNRKMDRMDKKVDAVPDSLNRKMDRIDTGLKDELEQLRDNATSTFCAEIMIKTQYDLTLHKEFKLPFVPYPGIRLSLPTGKKDDLKIDCSIVVIVEKVTWQEKLKIFYVNVELEKVSFSESDFVIGSKSGWYKLI